MTPLWVRIAFFAFGLFWLTSGILALTEGEAVVGVVKLAAGVVWLLSAFFRDRVSPRFEAALERQRAQVEGHGALSFLPDADSPQQRDRA